MMKETVSKLQITGDFRVVLSLSVIASTLWILKILWEKRQFFKKAAAIPNIVTGPFGATWDLFGKSIDECYQQLLEYFRTSPEIFKGWFGPILLVGVSKPEHLEIVLTNPATIGKSRFFDFLRPYLGNGLLHAPDDIWKTNRKLITPSFNKRVLDSFVPTFAEKCDILVGILEEIVGQPDVNIVEKMSRFTLDTVCETTMGIRLDAQTSPNIYGKSLDKIMEIATTRIFNLYYHPQIIFDRTKIGKQFSKEIKDMNGLSTRAIKHRKTAFEEKTQDYYIEEEDNRHIKSSLDLLVEISHNGDHFTDKQLQDEVNTLMAAGSDTTAVTLAFCCLTMGLHPEYQQKIYEEAVEILGEDRYATAEDLPKLKFTEMFIKETHRVFPIAPFLLRIATDDVKIDDLVIPKDTIILMGLMHLHRNPKYWEDPLKFNPYRFLPEEWSKKHTYSHLPFSGGPRNCIGSRYAMMFMKVVLTKIVRKFKVKTDYKCIEDVQLKMNLLLRPADGFKVSFDLRE